MQVVLGGLDLGKKESFEQTVAVEMAIVHEKYRETSSAVYNDIGEMLEILHYPSSLDLP